MHEPGAQTVLGKSYPDTGVEQGRAVLADLARHPATAQHVAHQARAPFHRRRAAAGAGRAAGASASSTPTAISRRWRRRWSTAPEAWDAPRSQAQAPGRVDDRGAARDRRHAGRHRPRSCRRITCWASRCGGRRRRRGSPTTARPGSTAWRSASTSPISSPGASSRDARSAKRSVEDGARPARLGRDAPGHRARREPAAGARAAADGARISAEMTMTLLHAPTRRELLLASGALFAWAHLPKLARAEGRDPRLLVIVLRGALDGLAAVAPVGDPDWVKLRGDKALALDGKTPGAAARRVLRAQSGDAEPASALPGRRRRPSCTRPRRPIASARISTARTCWKAASASRARPIPAGSTARSPRCSRGRARRSAAARPSRSGR